MAQISSGITWWLAAVTLAAAQAVYAKEELSPLALDAGFNVEQTAAKGFVIADTKALKGIKRVAVPVFALEFITADNVSAQTSGFGSGGRASMTSHYKLVASGSPAPIKSDNSMMMSPAGLGLYGFAKTGGGNSAKSKSLFGALSDMGGSFAAVGAITNTIQLATELDASLIEVRMRVNFAQLTNENKGFLGSLSTTATTSAKVFPSIDNVMMGVQTGPLRSTATLNHTPSLHSAAFSAVREKATTTGDVVGAVAVGLLKLAIGGKDSSESTEREVVADPVKYPEIVGAGLATATSLLVARMKTER